MDDAESKTWMVVVWSAGSSATRPSEEAQNLEKRGAIHLGEAANSDADAESWIANLMAEYLLMLGARRRDLLKYWEEWLPKEQKYIEANLNSIWQQISDQIQDILLEDITPYPRA